MSCYGEKYKFTGLMSISLEILLYPRIQYFRDRKKNGQTYSSFIDMCNAWADEARPLGSL